MADDGIIPMYGDKWKGPRNSEYMVAGKPGLKYYAEGLFFNRSTYAEELLTRYPVEGAVGDLIFPVVRVQNGPGLYVPVFGQDDTRQVPTMRAPGTEANAVGINVSSVYAYMKSRALAAWVPIEYEKADDGAWQLRESAILHLQRGLTIDKEHRVAAAVNSTSNVSSTFLPNSAWNVSGNAIRHVEHMISHVASAGGLRPDCLVFGAAAWSSFAVSSAVIARLGGYVTPARAAEVFRVGTVAISELRANVGAGADRRYDPIFPADVVLACRVGVPGAFDARWGCSPQWFPGAPPAKEMPRYLVEVHPLSRRNKSTRIELTTWEEETVIDPQLAAVLKSVNSSAGIGGIG